jgi:hypothetical protein
MAQENIFAVIAQGVGNANQNIVDTYKLIESLAEKIEDIHRALFPEDMSEPTSDGTAKSDKE